MAGQIKIVTYNANGIYGDIITLQELLQRKEVDIAFIRSVLRGLLSNRSLKTGYRNNNLNKPRTPR